MPLLSNKVSNTPLTVIASWRELPVADMPPADSVTVVPSSLFSAEGAAAPSLGASTSAFASEGGVPSAFATLGARSATAAQQGRARTQMDAALLFIGDGSPWPLDGRALYSPRERNCNGSVRRS